MHRTRSAMVQGWLTRTVAVASLLWALTSVALAQAADKTLHVGILSSGIRENRESLDQALVAGLRDQGYVEGKNLTIERRYGSSKLKDNAIELAGMKLDAILTTCTPSTRTMKELTSTTPIVMAAVSRSGAPRHHRQPSREARTKHDGNVEPGGRPAG